jgi:hypothetical protein
MEHRWGERSKLNLPVQVDCGLRGVVLGVMRDASASGAFVCTAAQVPLLASVRVVLGAAAAVRQHPEVEALVVWRAPDGFGLEWAELAPPEVVALLSAAHAAAALPLSTPEATRPAQQKTPATPPLTAERTVEETVVR